MGPTVAHRLIVGLGNPGPKYEKTRHNIGFMAVDMLSDRLGLPLTQQKFHGRYATGFCSSEKVTLLEPDTFMNLSGKSVVAARQFFQFEVDEVVVVHDELDLELGTVRVKIGGGHGGHNGLRDIAEKLGTRDFVRVRLGIGRPAHGAVTDWVLGAFKADEYGVVTDQLELACDVLEAIVRDGPMAAQNDFNGK